MDALHVQGDPNAHDLYRDFDAEALFELGRERMNAKDFSGAVLVYEKFLERFPQHSEAVLARYNLALSLMEDKRYNESLNAWDQILLLVKEEKQRSLFNDVSFHRAATLHKMERYQDAADAFYQLRLNHKLAELDELEAHVSQAVAQFMSGDRITAEVEFMNAILYFDGLPNKENLPADYFIGQARFYLGEIAARAFEEKQLSLPQESESKISQHIAASEEAWIRSLGEDLKEKCELLLRAQNNLIRAIRVGHVGWASAAGFRIGSLYEHLHQDMLRMPVPQTLDEEGKQFYQEELKKRVSVLVKKSIEAYESTLAMAKRTGAENSWIQESEESLQRMRSLLIE